MLIGGLVRIVSVATGVAESTVTVYARVLREAGLLTTGARGVNAPHMTMLDAARLLLAVMVTDKPARASGAVKDFGALTCQQIETHDENKCFGLSGAGDFQEGHTLEDALAAVIDIYATDWHEDYFNDARLNLPNGQEGLPPCLVRVRVSRLDAEITVFCVTYSYNDPLLPVISDAGANEGGNDALVGAAHHAKLDKYKTNIRVEKTIDASVIDTIATGLAPDVDE